MENLYSMAIINENKFKREITLPPEKYCINNTTDPDNGLINLNIPDITPSINHIEIELYKDNYYVSLATSNDQSVTEKIRYNSPCFYQEECLFVIKKQKEKWNKNILAGNKERNQTGNKRMKISIIFTTLMLSAMLTLYFIHWSDNKIINEKKTDYNDIIKQYDQKSEYITSGNNILIFTSDNNMIDYVKKNLPDYNIHKLDKNTLKTNQNDIVVVSKLDSKKQIIYINTEINNADYDISSIPEIFRNSIIIRSFSFDDIVKLINNRFEHKLMRYSVGRSNNNIIIYYEKMRHKEIDDIIHDINTAIFSTPGNTLIQHREISNKERFPGVYGTDNYYFLSDNHIKFISDNK